MIGLTVFIDEDNLVIFAPAKQHNWMARQRRGGGGGGGGGGSGPAQATDAPDPQHFVANAGRQSLSPPVPTWPCPCLLGFLMLTGVGSSDKRKGVCQVRWAMESHPVVKPSLPSVNRISFVVGFSSASSAMVITSPARLRFYWLETTDFPYGVLPRILASA